MRYVVSIPDAPVRYASEAAMCDRRGQMPTLPDERVGEVLSAVRDRA